MCGSYTLSNFLLKKGGLVGNYYSNKYLLNEPTLTQVDTQINFNWGSDAMLFSKKDSVSVEWNGYLKTEQASSYTFKTLSNDGVRVYVNQNLVIDQWTTVTDEIKGQIKISEPLILAQETFVPIKVQYYDNSGAAFLSLMWKLDDQPEEVVGSANLYYIADHKPLTGTNSLITA